MGESAKRISCCCHLSVLSREPVTNPFSEGLAKPQSLTKSRTVCVAKQPVRRRRLNRTYQKQKARLQFYCASFSRPEKLELFIRPQLSSSSLLSIYSPTANYLLFRCYHLISTLKLSSFTSADCNNCTPCMHSFNLVYTLTKSPIFFGTDRAFG